MANCQHARYSPHPPEHARRRLRTIAAANLLFVCALIFPAYGRSIADLKGIPEAEAVHLLRVYLQSAGYDTKSPKFDIEINSDNSHPDNTEKGFYLYDVYVNGPEHLETIGAYGVNAETGDIWERIGCKRVESRAIASLQKQIRDASGLSESELERLRNMHPCF